MRHKQKSPEAQKTEWKDQIKSARGSKSLNTLAVEIAGKMYADLPPQGTVLEVMAAYEKHPDWDKKTKPFRDLATSHNKIDTGFIGPPPPRRHASAK